MNNILIPTDFSLSSRNAIHYSLYLMRGREAHFYFLFLPFYQNFVVRKTYSGSDSWACIQFILKQEVSIFKRNLVKYFPNEKFNFHFLNSKENLRAIKDSVSLIVLDNQLIIQHLSVLYQNILKKVNAPLLIIPSKARFTPPKIVLLKVFSGIMPKVSILAPLKEIYGNHSFSLEIHKILSGPVDPENKIKIVTELRDLFNIYHPVIKILNNRENDPSKENQEQKNYDLQMLFLEKKNLKKKMTDSGFMKGLFTIMKPLLITSGIHEEQPPGYKRVKKNSNKIIL